MTTAGGCKERASRALLRSAGAPVLKQLGHVIDRHLIPVLEHMIRQLVEAYSQDHLSRID